MTPVSWSKNKRLKTYLQFAKWFHSFSSSREFFHFFMKKLMMGKIGELGKRVLTLSYKLLNAHQKSRDWVT
jgi:hypothetical protein